MRGSNALMCYCRSSYFCLHTDILFLLIRNTTDVTKTGDFNESAYTYFMHNSARKYLTSGRNEYIEQLLQGKVTITNTKYARNI